MICITTATVATFGVVFRCSEIHLGASRPTGADATANMCLLPTENSNKVSERNWNKAVIEKPETPDILEAAIYADDLDAAERFYGRVLGFRKIARVGDRHVFFRFRNTVLLVFNASETRKPSGNPNLPVPPHGMTGAGHVCFAASSGDLDQWADVFLSHSIAIEADFRWPDGCRSIYVRDPSGNSVEFAERGLWFQETGSDN